MSRLFVLAFCFTVMSHVDGYRGPFRRLYPTGKVTPVQADDDPGEALFLTPLIEQGKIEEAKTLR